MNDKNRKRLGWLLTGIFVLAMLMGPGPGLLLFANRPVPSLGGLPLLYVWGIGWFFVQVFVVLTAYLFVWRDPEDSAADGSDPAAMKRARPHE